MPSFEMGKSYLGERRNNHPGRFIEVVREGMLVKSGKVEIYGKERP